MEESEVFGPKFVGLLAFGAMIVAFQLGEQTRSSQFAAFRSHVAQIGCVQAVLCESRVRITDNGIIVFEVVQPSSGASVSLTVDQELSWSSGVLLRRHVNGDHISTVVIASDDEVLQLVDSAFSFGCDTAVCKSSIRDGRLFLRAR